ATAIGIAVARMPSIIAKRFIASIVLSRGDPLKSAKREDDRNRSRPYRLRPLQKRRVHRTLVLKREAASLMDAPGSLFVATNITPNRQSDKGMTGDGPDGP